MVAWSETQTWAGLSAPVCAIFAARTAAQADYGADTSPSGFVSSTWLTFGLAACMVSVAVWTAESASAAIGVMIFLCVLCHLAVIDLRWMLVPLRLSLALILAGEIFVAMAAGWKVAATHLLAAGLGWLLFRALDLGFRQLRGRSGLGEGDALLAAGIAAWLGAQGLAWSVALGATLTLTAQVLGHQSQKSTPIPFAPGLAAGAFCALLLARTHLGALL